MADTYMSMEHLQFLLHEVYGLGDILSFDRYADYDSESINMLLGAAKDFSDRDLFPYFVDMDAEPVRYEDGKIIAHPQLGKILQSAAENGWLGSTFDYEHGGIQMPHMAFNAATHIFQSANNSAIGYIGLLAGAAKLIVSFGSKELFETYVPKMLEGKWMGTMALTEPQAGSSLSDIITSATPTEDGHYLIKGQKIFISGGRPSIWRKLYSSYVSQD